VSKDFSASPFLEVREVLSRLRGMPRSPRQSNAPFESDAEILQLPDGSWIATTIDTLSEEFAWGLVRDPLSMGWLGVTASASDLAAVGLAPTGLLLGLGSPASATGEQLAGLSQGAELAARAYGTFILGGDTGGSKDWLLSCAAFALSKEKPRLGRLGARAGDAIYLTGRVGWGNAVGLANVTAHDEASRARAAALDKAYRPTARSKEAPVVARFASAAIDTSDGLVSALDLLAELNGLGFEARYDADLFHSAALQVAQAAGMDPWLFAAAQNGEFELLLAVPAEVEDAFLEAMSAQGCSPLRLGRFTVGREAVFETPTGRRSVDLAGIRNLLAGGVRVDEYIRRLVDFGIQAGLKAR
jgi:thiamine-monophosphate kinase